MNFLRTFFIFCFLFFSITEASAQVYRFKAESYSVVEKKDNGNWGEWSKFQETAVIITLDGKNDKITVNSQEVQYYKILAYGEKVVTEDDDTIPLKCADLNGNLCTILIVTRKNQDNRKQFYINYGDVKIVYNVYDN
ncbi:hypothetical protein J2X31_003198 [Flavobacterium arsenatis]|uniref:Uncharacterized protein n=1 Tax=Flavobacterium arsenatis TaxID=1484332 RepID=A0ABU1TTK6_9FLAO|nr:hypothetical protein [Flavobacterium arsenatis]MDR6969171.1 hypothetical protein [Flavobacterium arsenatis]